MQGIKHCTVSGFSANFTAANTAAYDQSFQEL